MCSSPGKSDSSHCGKHFSKSMFAAEIDYKLLQWGLGFLRWVTVFLLTCFLRWWMAPGCHPSLTSTDPTHLSHMSNQSSIPLLSWCTDDPLRLHLWEEHHSSQVHKPPDKQPSTSSAWTKPGLFLTAQSSALSGLGGCSHWRKRALKLSAQEQLSHPPVSMGFQESPMGMRRASQHWHTERSEHYFSQENTAAVALRVFTLAWDCSHEQHYHIHDLKAVECQECTRSVWPRAGTQPTAGPVNNTLHGRFVEQRARMGEDVGLQ